MTKSLEKWISEIQYQALNDNYLKMPGDWADQMRIDALRELKPGPGQYSCGYCGTGLEIPENMLNGPESHEKNARLSTKGD